MSRRKSTSGDANLEVKLAQILPKSKSDVRNTAYSTLYWAVIHHPQKGEIPESPPATLSRKTLPFFQPLQRAQSSGCTTNPTEEVLLIQTCSDKVQDFPERWPNDVEITQPAHRTPNGTESWRDTTGEKHVMSQCINFLFFIAKLPHRSEAQIYSDSSAMTGGLNSLVFALTMRARLDRGATTTLANKRLCILERKDPESLLTLLLIVHSFCSYT